MGSTILGALIISMHGHQTSSEPIMNINNDICMKILKTEKNNGCISLDLQLHQKALSSYIGMYSLLSWHLIPRVGNPSSVVFSVCITSSSSSTIA